MDREEFKTEILETLKSKGWNTDNVGYIDLINDLLDIESIKKLFIPVVMPMLLCIDSKNASNLTKDKKYTPMSIGNHVYKLIDDNNNVVYLAKPRFRIIEA